MVTNSKKAKNCKNVQQKKLPCIFAYEYVMLIKKSHDKK